jgi:hypothetical protein
VRPEFFKLGLKAIHLLFGDLVGDLGPTMDAKAIVATLFAPCEFSIGQFIKALWERPATLNSKKVYTRCIAAPRILFGRRRELG